MAGPLAKISEIVRIKKFIVYITSIQAGTLKNVQAPRRSTPDHCESTATGLTTRIMGEGGVDGAMVPFANITFGFCGLIEVGRK